MNNENLELAKEIEFNEKAEAQAILDYTEFLRKLDTLPNIDGLDKEFIEFLKEFFNLWTRIIK